MTCLKTGMTYNCNSRLNGGPTSRTTLSSVIKMNEPLSIKESSARFLIPASNVHSWITICLLSHDVHDGLHEILFVWPQQQRIHRLFFQHREQHTEPCMKIARNQTLTGRFTQGLAIHRILPLQSNLIRIEMEGTLGRGRGRGREREEIKGREDG